MQLAANQLQAQLQKGLRSLYTLHGDEPLLIQEAGDAIRAAARAQGHTERTVHTMAGAHADWSAVLASGASLSLFADRQLIEVRVPTGKPGKDGSVALQQLATAWRRRFTLPLVAVTGSNGKTTVTQMIASILRAAHGDAAFATRGNLNNHIGVPLTLLRLRPHHRSAVVELGMNHPGEIAELAAITRPTVALVNNAQREHQEFMASVEAVARENGSVFAALAEIGRAHV